MGSKIEFEVGAVVGDIRFAEAVVAGIVAVVGSVDVVVAVVVGGAVGVGSLILFFPAL